MDESYQACQPEEFVEQGPVAAAHTGRARVGSCRVAEVDAADMNQDEAGAACLGSLSRVGHAKVGKDSHSRRPLEAHWGSRSVGTRSERVRPLAHHREI